MNRYKAGTYFLQRGRSDDPNRPFIDDEIHPECAELASVGANDWLDARSKIDDPEGGWNWNTP